MHNCGPRKPKKIAAEPLFGPLSTGWRKKMRTATQPAQGAKNVTLSTSLPRLAA